MHQPLPEGKHSLCAEKPFSLGLNILKPFLGPDRKWQLEVDHPPCGRFQTRGHRAKSSGTLRGCIEHLVTNATHSSLYFNTEGLVCQGKSAAAIPRLTSMVFVTSS
jgi:hypothetical protein